jgi:hypothetical protein
VALVITQKNNFFVLVLIAIPILFTSFGSLQLVLDVLIRNDRDENIIVYATAFDYLQTKDPHRIPGSYTFEYFGMDAGGVRLGAYSNPMEIQSKTDITCYDYPSFPEIPGWHDIPVEEQFKLVYKEFTVYDSKGNILLTLEEITADKFVKQAVRTGKIYDWYLVIE